MLKACGEGKFDPPPPKNPLANSHKNLRTWLSWVCLPSCQILSRSVKGLFLHMRDFVHSCVLVVFFWGGGSFNHLQPRCVQQFQRKIHQMMQRKVSFGWIKRANKISSEQPKSYLLSMFWPLSEAFIRRSWYWVFFRFLARQVRVEPRKRSYVWLSW